MLCNLYGNDLREVIGEFPINEFHFPFPTVHRGSLYTCCICNAMYTYITYLIRCARQLPPSMSTALYKVQAGSILVQGEVQVFDGYPPNVYEGTTHLEFL
mgnify:FL=1